MSSEIKKQLSNIKSQHTHAYEHIKKLITNLALDQQGLHSFQHYSYKTRQPQKQQIVFKVREAYHQIQNYENANRVLLNKVNIGSAQQPQQPASFTYIPDLMQEAQVFGRLGIGFGEDQTYRIYKSLCNLTIKKSTKQVRLWGKILGTQKDYYIAEGLADGGQDPGELAPDTEPKGTGINKWNYWVSTCLTNQWTELPLITPQQLRTSRKIKYIFSGDLKRNILTNPIFNGTQAHLLKCQIVRINSSCSIIPKGIYATNADDPKQIQFAQTYSFPEVSQLGAKQNWVYFSPVVLKNGRISHIKPEGLQEQQAQKLLKKMMQTDPLQPRLKVIAMDGQNWMIRSVGVEETYKTLGKNPKVVSKGVVGVKSLIWPGWTTVGWQGKYSSIYVGYGHKQKFTYFPRQPETILQECADREQVSKY